MNSRSLSHKENYSLRDLIFTIPLREESHTKVVYHNTESIGTMNIIFDDRPADKNRAADDVIRLQIEKKNACLKKAKEVN